MEAPSGNIQKDTVTVRHLGVTTLLIQDGETSILIDGFFSRPSKIDLLLDLKVKPNEERIKRWVEFAGIKKLDAIIVLHSHYDHAMDVAEVANRFEDVVIYGSSSTKNIALGGGVAAGQISEIITKKGFPVGKFNIVAHESEHFPLKFRRKKLLNTKIEEVLSPPASITEYGQGKSYILCIDHPEGTMLIQGSAGFPKESLVNVIADVVFLGIGGLGSKKEDYFDGYWSELVEKTRAHRVYPIHWDDPTRPLSSKIQSTPAIFDNVELTLERMLDKAYEQDRAVELLPINKPIQVFRGSGGSSCKDRKHGS